MLIVQRVAHRLAVMDITTVEEHQTIIVTLRIQMQQLLV